MKARNYAKDALFGVAVGDALGVPVEFISRETLRARPVTGMRGNGTHNQPAGTWSDDSSLTFCLAEMLLGNYDLKTLAGYFVNWKHWNYWTPHGSVFDIGNTTAFAIDKIGYGVDPLLAGGSHEDENGNGSLMRILPIIFYNRGSSVDERFKVVREISSLTHRHVRSIVSCFIYTEYALCILNGLKKFDAYEEMKTTVRNFLFETDTCTEKELSRFSRVLELPIGDGDAVKMSTYFESEISSSGYVLSTLEASLWCILNTDNYRDAVLKAVNLGSDSDTTAAVTGGLAGLLYGFDSIPAQWVEVLARKNDIEDLCNRLHRKVYDKQ